MYTLILIYLFVLGACFGSFAGAMAWRIEKRKNVLNERSECEYCHHTLGVLDLIPVASWLWLRGKCRYCRRPIGWTAFALEVGLGSLFVLSYAFWPGELVNVADWLCLVLWLVSLVMLAILFVYDLRHFLLPDVVMWPLIGVGAAYFVSYALTQQWGIGTALIEAIASLVPVAGLYGALWLISNGKWVGFGDVKLGVFMGLILGWQDALLAVILANLIGTIIVLPGFVSGRLKRTTHIPFGPFLILATIIAFLFGAQIIDWYFSLLSL